MVSYQTSSSAAGAGAAQENAPPQHPHPASSSSWSDDQSENVWGDVAPSSNRDGTQNTGQHSNVPGSLMPGGTQRSAPPPPAQQSSDEGSVWVEGDNQTQQPSQVDRVPSILRPGGRNNNSNPFRAKDSQPSPSAAAAAPAPPSDDFGKLNIGPPSTNPWSSAMATQKTGPTTETKSPPVIPSNMDNDPWSAPEAVIVEPPSATRPFGVPPHTEEQSPWADGNKRTESEERAAQVSSPVSDKLFEALDEQEQGVWDDLGALDKKQGKAAEDSDDQDDWNMIDSETSSLASGKMGKAATRTAEKPPPTESPSQNLMDEPAMDPGFAAAAIPPTIVEPAGETKGEPVKEIGQQNTGKSPEEGPLPTFTDAEETLVEDSSSLPLRKEEPERWASTRQPVDGKTETYQIKNIRWHDPSCSNNPRVSPILMQNENGPCPLVALVNALSLTTSSDLSDTTLVQVLRSRERVSLNLVLDAVFDELMSPRRTSSEDALPDITELYEFLQSLHTGMNVNPRYVPTEQMVRAYKRSSLTHLHPTEREDLMPGTFENSLEMRLYATFSIPLIHGWLPAKSDPAYSAFERQAASYEDVQNLLFREEDLEAKLSDPGGGLSGPEQQLYQDIMSIKMFMQASATQLTQVGIDVISKAIRPGTFAIFFRNDHFSTLYCHPRTMQLLTLVTDAGYSSHDEVVWESLVDVNGERTELYSGDFRAVSGSGAAGPSSSSAYSGNQGGAWTTVQGRRGKDRQEEPELERPLSANREQEDRDLALALQLQEEEEQKQREEQERRSRESRLSEQFIEQQGRRPQPVNREQRRPSAGSTAQLAPARSSSSTVNSSAPAIRRPSEPHPNPPSQQIRPMVPPRRQPVSRPSESAEEAPPSYEQAAHDTRVNPTTGQPNAGPGAARPGGSMNSGFTPGFRPVRMNPVIRPPVGSSHYERERERERERDCVVM